MTANIDLWDHVIETMSRSEIECYQSVKLRKQVKHVYEDSRFWHELYDRARIRPEEIHGVHDLYKLPIVSKDDLRRQRAKTGDAFSDALCVPHTQLVRTNRSTGTTGTPNVYGLTRADYEIAADAFARMLYTLGLRPGYRTNGSSEGCLGWHGWFMLADGARRIGCTVYTAAQSMPTIAEEALDTLAGVNLDAIFVYHPEFEGNYIRSKGIKPKEIHPNLKFTYASFLASDARRKIIEDVWGVPYRNGAGGGDQYITGAECIYSAPAHGAHMMEDRLIIEVLDPNTWEPVAPGNYGELVVTNLWAEASPYIRYRTEDIVVADYTPCPCGNTHVKLRFLGRMPWSVDVQGHRIFTDDVENVTWRYSETEFAPYQLVRYKEQPQKELILRVVYRHKTEKSEEDVREMLTRALEKEFAVPCKVELVSPEEIAVGFVKFQRIVEVPGKQP